MKRNIYENITRTLHVLVTIVVAIIAGDNLNNFLSLLGSGACIHIAFTLPALFHYKICAKTEKEKFIDISLICVAVLLSFFCTCFTIYNW